MSVMGLRRFGSGGALFTLAVLFLASGLLRFMDGTGFAFATESLLPPQATLLGNATPEDPGLAPALAAIQKREERVRQERLALDDRKRLVEAAEIALARKLADLEAAEMRLSATMAQSQVAAEEDLARLTSVYENMKPKQAADLFAQMTPEFAAGFLGRMRADAAAAIMAGLDPTAAYSISVLLAGRNANAPTN